MKKNIYKKIICLGTSFMFLAGIVTGCGKEVSSDNVDGLTKVTLNEVAHSIKYPYKSNK